MALKSANNLSSTLAAQLLSGGTTVTVQTGQGANWAAANGSDYIIATLYNLANSKKEIVKVTNRSGDNLTIARNQETIIGFTPPFQFEIGDYIEARVTKSMIETAFNFTGRTQVAGRLTLTSGTAITTSDVTAATTLYFTPYKGNTIALYDGSSWETLSFSELSIAVPGTTDTMYDVFIYSNSGVATLELTAWTNDTTRATALTTQDGVLVKTGSLTRRYVGSIRTTGVSGQTEDSKTNRYVWNYYNRTKRPLYRIESTNSWVYTSDTVRQANGSTSNQVNFIIGVSEDNVSCHLLAMAYGTDASTEQRVSIGLDSTTAFSSDATCSFSSAAGGYLQLVSNYEAFPGIGKHYLSWLEGGATGVTFYGYSAGRRQTGLSGFLLG